MVHATQLASYLLNKRPVLVVNAKQHIELAAFHVNLRSAQSVSCANSFLQLMQHTLDLQQIDHTVASLFR